jgi:hypothetical protein
MPPLPPPVWDSTRLIEDARASTQLFREERMTEPLEMYTEHFESARANIENLLETTVDLETLEEHALQLLSDPDTLDVVRYLAGPPISKDDLETVGEIRLSPSALVRQPSSALVAIETVKLGLDRNRFPWVSENRDPTESERNAAIVATAALMAGRKVMTARANDGKTAQEQKVKDALVDLGFTEVASRTIPTLVQAPGRGEFCGESLLGPRKADVVVRLWDDRVMAIECKVSNSATNSVKRLNNDAAVKAGQWLGQFGTAQMVPSAMLAGVFKPLNLESAQTSRLTIWWSHDLSTMTNWIEATR